MPIHDSEMFVEKRSEIPGKLKWFCHYEGSGLAHDPTVVVRNLMQEWHISNSITGFTSEWRDVPEQWEQEVGACDEPGCTRVALYFSKNRLRHTCLEHYHPALCDCKILATQNQTP